MRAAAACRHRSSSPRRVDVPPFANSSMDGYALRAADAPGRAAGGRGGGGRRRNAARRGSGHGRPDHDRRPDAAGRRRGCRRSRSWRKRRLRCVVPATEPGAYVRRAGQDTAAGELVSPAGGAAHGRHAGDCWPRWASARSPCVAARGSRSCRPATSCGRPVRRWRRARSTTPTDLPWPRRSQRPAASPCRWSALRTIRRRSSSWSCVARRRPTCWWPPAACRVGASRPCARRRSSAWARSTSGASACSRASRSPLASVRGVPVLGLPGNPVSALVTFELFVRPLIRAHARPVGWRPA